MINKIAANTAKFVKKNFESSSMIVSILMAFYCDYFITFFVKQTELI